MLRETLRAMAKANTKWTVHPHGPLEKLSDRVWRIEGALPNVPMKRVMTIAKRADGSLVVHNGIGVDEKVMAEVDAWGPVGTIVVPNAYHRLDAKVFKDRYPNAKIVCPSGATKKVREVVAVDGGYDSLQPDDAVELQHLDGTKEREGAMLVRDRDGTTVVFNDAVFNMPHLSGFTGFVLKSITGSSGGPRVSRIMKWFVIADKQAFRAHLERIAALPDLRRIVVSHHETIDDNASLTLRAVAAAI